MDARMITYSYDPLIGKTGECDANNKITYYEYDELGRLNLIRNDDKSIFKKISYNYDGLSENSNIWYSNEINSTFYKQNCSTGQNPIVYPVAISQGAYTSSVSQQDANDLALQAAQNEADLNGLCEAPPPTCELPSKRIVNGVCKKGLKVYTSSVYDPVTGQYICTFHYEWIDGYKSGELQQFLLTPCI